MRLTGFNVRINGDANRDNTMRDHRAIGADWILVHDDPALAHQAAAEGTRVIYRQSGDDPTSGRDAIHENNPDGFVAERAQHGIPNALIHATNEINYSPALITWTRGFMAACEARGVRGVILNYSTHRSAAEWEASRAVIAEAVARGHAIGVHVYQNRHGDPDAHHYRKLQAEIGGLWLVTEWGWITPDFNPGNGWRGNISADEYAAFLKAEAPSYAARGMVIFPFSYEHWQVSDYGRAEGFKYGDAPEFLNAMREVNAMYPVIPQHTPSKTGIVRPGKPINVRVEKPTLTTIRGQVQPGTQVTYYPKTDDGKTYRIGNYTYRIMWVEAGASSVINGIPHRAITGWCAMVESSWEKQFLDPAAPPPVTPLKLRLPYAGADWVMTAPYGEPRDYDGDGVKDDVHEGIDYAPLGIVCAPGKYPILSAADGIVEQVMTWGELETTGAFTTGYGIYVKIAHPHGADTYHTIYAHLSAPSVCEGDAVKAGDVIGILGSTGNSTAPHLHFTLKKNGAVVDPSPYF